MTDLITSTAQIIFNKRKVRVVLMQEQYWFVAKDIAAALDIKWNSRLLNNVHNEQKKKFYHQLFCYEKKNLWLIKASGLTSLLVKTSPKKACALMTLLTGELFPDVFNSKVKDMHCFFENLWQVLAHLHDYANELKQLNEDSSFSIVKAKMLGQKMCEKSRMALLGLSSHMKGGQFLTMIMDEEQKKVATHFNQELI